MAVDERTLLVDYEALDEILGHLQAMEDQAVEIRDLLTRHTDNLAGGLWQGQGASAYYREFDEVIKPALDRLVDGTEQAQSTMTAIKGETQTLEEQIAAYWREMIGLLPWGAVLTKIADGLTVSGFSLTGLGKLASNAAADAARIASFRYQQMASIFARGGEEALQRSGVHAITARWAARSARAAQAADILNRWSDRLGKVGVGVTVVGQGVRSSAETWMGRLTSSGAAGAFAWGTRANPVVAAADVAGIALGVDGPSSVMNASFESIVVTTEGLITGSPVGMANLHERQLAGEWGPLFREAAEAGDFWAEHGLIGGGAMFFDAVGEMVEGAGGGGSW